MLNKEQLIYHTVFVDIIQLFEVRKETSEINK